MPILTRPAFGPITALAYVTGGLLMCVWTAVWYFTRDYELTRSQWFWVAGIFLSGATFLLLGLVLGRLGRAARRAEMPPMDVTPAEATIQQTAAANPPAVVNAPNTGMAATAGGAATSPTMNPAMPPAPPVQVSPAS